MHILRNRKVSNKQPNFTPSELEKEQQIKPKVNRRKEIRTEWEQNRYQEKANLWLDHEKKKRHK